MKLAVILILMEKTKMAKMMIKKDVYEQVTSKLQSSKDDEFREEYDAGFIEGLKSKNIFSRGDFDDWKISNEELEEHYEIEKAQKGRKEKYPIGYVNETNHTIKVSKTEWKPIPQSKYQPGTLNTERRKLAASLPLISKTEIKQVKIDASNYLIESQKYYYDIQKIFQNVTRGHCKAIQNKKVVLQTFSQNHFFDHDVNESVQRTKLLPYVPEIVEQYGVYFDHRVKNHRFEQEIIGKAEIDGKEVIISVCFVSKGDLLFLTIFDTEIKKSLIRGASDIISHSGITGLYTAFTPCDKVFSLNRCTENIIANSKNKSSNINKSLTYSGHKLQGRTKLYGMDISIENKKGSYRSGVDGDGHKWRTYMNYDYGYIRGTVGTDGDHTDCYIGPDENATKVYVIHQNNPVTHKYDEDKCMMCFESADAAKKAYMKQYDRPGFFGSMETLTIDQFKSFVFSKQGKRIHKSFDITITDITENNKQQKVEQLEKSLIAIAENKPFVIKHIDSDNESKRYDNLVLRITDFDKTKIQKAVHEVAFTLDTKIKSAKGEAFNYKAQEELTDRISDEFTEKTKDIYSFLIGYFGLPEIRIVAKADMSYKGKVIYNPETGKPLTKSEWDKFVKAFERLLSNKYSGMGKKIVLSSETLGRLLAKLSETNSFEKVKQFQLNQLSYKHRGFEWISNTAQNMQNVFGESLSRERQARVQVAIDCAAQRVTKVSDEMKNNIQEIILEGIRDKQSKSVVSQKLFKECTSINRDFQRIADTEIQNNTNVAYVKEQVYNTKPDEKVYFRRFEQMDNITCKKCRSLNDKIALFSDVPLEDEHIDDEYADYAIWEGKIDGTAPMGTVHPWCRGSWIRYTPSRKYF